MRAINDIVQQFDPGRGPGRGMGSVSSMRRSSARTSGRESSGRMNDLKSKMQSRGESPPGRAERTRSGLLTGQGTHFQSSALRTHMRKDSGAYMAEEEYQYTKRKPSAQPSAPARQDVGYDYGYGYEEEQMMPETTRPTRVERQPATYVDEEGVQYVEAPQQMPSATRATVPTAPQQVRYVVEQPRMEAAGPRRTTGMGTGMDMGMEYQPPSSGMYHSAQTGGKAAMRPHKTRQLYIEDQPRMQAAGASRATGAGYKEQPKGEVYRPSHIGGMPRAKTLQTRYIQEQPRMGTTEARVRPMQEQPPGQVFGKSHVGAQPSMRPAQRAQTVYVRKVPPEQLPQRAYTQKQPQPRRQTVYVQKAPQPEIVRAPRVSGMGQPRMRYDQVPREPQIVRIPHVNGKPATEVQSGQQGMGYMQEYYRPKTIYIPAERGSTRPVTTTSMRSGPSMRSQRNQRLSTSYEPVSPYELRRESTKSSHGSTGVLGVHDTRDAAVSAAAAAILGGKVKPQRRVTHIPTAPAGEYGAGVLRRDSVTLPQRQPVYYDKEQYVQEPVAPPTDRLREEIYVSDGTYETIEREPPVVTETVLPQRRVEEVPSRRETPRMAKREPQLEGVVVKEPVTVGEPIHERVVIPEEDMEQREEMAAEGREEAMHEERMVQPSKLMGSYPALTEQVVTEPVVEQEVPHPAIGMPDDEDIEREAKMRQQMQAQEMTVPGFEAREEVVPAEEAVEEEFQPAKEIPSEEEESENEWDQVTEEEVVTEQYEVREPQPPLAPLAAVPVMAQTTTTTTAEAAKTAPEPAPPARETVSHHATYMYEEVREPRAFEKPVTVSGVMPPGITEPGEPMEEPMMESMTTTIPAEPFEEHYVSAKPSMESQRHAVPVTTTTSATKEPTTIPGTMESVFDAQHDERAFNTRASADAGATGRMSTDEQEQEQMRGTGRRSTDYNVDYGRQPRLSTAHDEQKHGVFSHRTMAEEQARERAGGVESQKSEARAREAAMTAAEEKGGPLDTVAGMRGEQTAQTAPAAETAETGAAATAAAAGGTGAGVGAGAGAGAGAEAAEAAEARQSTEGLGRAEKRQLEKEAKAREKQRLKEQKQYEANRKAQEQRLAKQRKDEEKQRRASEKKAEKEAKTRRKSLAKEDMQRQKSREKERRKSEQQASRSGNGNGNGGAAGQRQSADAGAGEKEHGLSGFFRRVSRTFTGEGSGSGAGVNQGTRVQQGAQQMQTSSGMETMGRPQDVAVP